MLSASDEGRYHNKGRTAFYNGVPYNRCPFRARYLRRAWRQGWLEAKYERNEA